jgi:cystathionine beta-lyase/cystathionine gamma-synthase
MTSPVDDELRLRRASQVVHAGQRPEAVTGAVIPPIFTSATYAQESPGRHKGFEYSRSHNPTRYALERMVARLEGGTITEAEDPSFGGFAFASGMAAMATILDLLSPGDRVVAMDDLYGGSNRIFRRVRERSQGLAVELADLSSPEVVDRVLTPETRLVWVETPTNPMMKLCDLEAIARLARERAPEVLLACDNTFATPIFQRPLEHGFDLVVHSTTKYLNGHSDAVGGVAVVRDAAFAARLRFLQNAIGAVASPWDSYLTLRGIKTLALRMERHQANATRIALHLESHPAVAKVIYPGLSSYPQRSLYLRQMDGASGMITFFLRGDLAAVRRVLERVRVFQLAESLGAVESLVNHPAIMTHASVAPEMRAKLGITDDMIRLSVGIEDPDDLVEDLDRALAAA